MSLIGRAGRFGSSVDPLCFFGLNLVWYTSGGFAARGCVLEEGGGGFSEGFEGAEVEGR